MEPDTPEAADTKPSANQQIQIFGKILNYGLMILGAVGIVYFIATGSIIGF